MLIYNDKWFIPLKKELGSKLRLFCFHHSGTGASTFHEWIKNVPDYIELIAIQLPGRESRSPELLIDNIQEVVSHLLFNFNLYKDKPFVLYGHSVGALIAFEFAKGLRRENTGLLHLIVSGLNSPQTLMPRNFHTLPDAEFLLELKKYNGVPEVIIQDKELMNLLLPVLRSDFKLFETYVYLSSSPLLCPITALGGLNDHTFNYKNLIRWKELTSGSFKTYLFKSDHFFTKKLYNEVIEVINKILNHYTLG